jgi:hypothetical protein
MAITWNEVRPADETGVLSQMDAGRKQLLQGLQGIQSAAVAYGDKQTKDHTEAMLAPLYAAKSPEEFDSAVAAAQLVGQGYNGDYNKEAFRAGTQDARNLSYSNATNALNRSYELERPVANRALLKTTTVGGFPDALRLASEVQNPAAVKSIYDGITATNNAADQQANADWEQQYKLQVLRNKPNKSDGTASSTDGTGATGSTPTSNNDLTDTQLAAYGQSGVSGKGGTAVNGGWNVVNGRFVEVTQNRRSSYNTAEEATNAALPKIMKAEGTGKNPSSSARGQGQIVDSTLLDLARRYSPELFKGQGDDAVLKAARSNPNLLTQYSRAYALEGAQQFQKEFPNTAVTPSDVYGMYMFPALYPKIYREVASNPNTPISAIAGMTPEIIRGNKLYPRVMVNGKEQYDTSRVLTLGEFMQRMDDKTGTTIKGNTAPLIPRNVINNFAEANRNTLEKYDTASKTAQRNLLFGTLEGTNALSAANRNAGEKSEFGTRLTDAGTTASMTSALNKFPPFVNASADTKAAIMNTVTAANSGNLISDLSPRELGEIVDNITKGQRDRLLAPPTETAYAAWKTNLAKVKQELVDLNVDPDAVSIEGYVEMGGLNNTVLGKYIINEYYKANNKALTNPSDRPNSQVGKQKTVRQRGTVEQVDNPLESAVGRPSTGVNQDVQRLQEATPQQPKAQSRREQYNESSNARNKLTYASAANKAKVLRTREQLAKDVLAKRAEEAASKKREEADKLAYQKKLREQQLKDAAAKAARDKVAAEKYRRQLDSLAKGGFSTKPLI